MMPFMAPMMMGQAEAVPVASATWSPADNGGLTLSNNNLRASGAANQRRSVRATLGRAAGKYAFEVTIDSLNNFVGVGLAKSSFGLNGNTGPGLSGTDSIGALFSSVYYNGSSIASYADLAAGVRMSVYFDATAGKVWFFRNGTNVSGGSPASGTGGHSLGAGTWFPVGAGEGPSDSFTANFGQSAFAYALPSGFSPWG